MHDMHVSWVPETRFGTWFQSHWMWTDYVLQPAFEDLSRLISGRKNRYLTIFDAGCGAGHAFNLLAEEFLPDEIIGIEVDPESVRVARENVLECTSRVSVIQGSVEQTCLDDESVDMIFCHQTIHHVVDQGRTVQEFYRVLKPEGVLLVSESCRKFINSVWVRALFRHPARIPQSADGFLRLFRDEGFSVAEDMVSYPRPFWAERDFGLMSAMGCSRHKSKIKNIINCIAVK